MLQTTNSGRGGYRSVTKQNTDPSLDSDSTKVYIKFANLIFVCTKWFGFQDWKCNKYFRGKVKNKNKYWKSAQKMDLRQQQNMIIITFSIHLKSFFLNNSKNPNICKFHVWIEPYKE